MQNDWLRPLQKLTEECKSFTVWKHLEAALAGRGDVDACVDPEDLECATLLFARIALRDWQAKAVVYCDHLSAVRIAVALACKSGPSIAELDLMHGTISKLGVTWASSNTFVELAQLNEDGIRELRPGAQVVVEIMTRGLENREPLTTSTITHLRAMLTQDRIGADLAVKQMLPKRTHELVVKILDDLACLRWNHLRVLGLKTHLGMDAIRHPSQTVRRLKVRHLESSPCLMRSIATRRIKHPPSEVDLLIKSAEHEGHSVLTYASLPDTAN